MSRAKNIAKGVEEVLKKQGYNNPGFVMLYSVKPDYQNVVYTTNLKGSDALIAVSAAKVELECEQTENQLKGIEKKIEPYK